MSWNEPRFGEQEKRNLTGVIDSGQLFYHGGQMTSRLRERACSWFGSSHVAFMSSGTAAIHCAIGALGLEPGVEVITPPITDMGTVIGPLYQNLVPVFADVDPHTYNIDASTIASKITGNTGAIIVVHLAGNPARMGPILDLATSRGIPVIEDCAQAYGAAIDGKKVGTLGIAGCYSLNAFKHVSCGDGGFVITGDKVLHEKVANFADKAYDRAGTGDRLGQLAPCYRITELQSAVALAQFEKLDAIVKRRRELGDRFNKGIHGIEGIHPHHVDDGHACSYWFTMFRVDPGRFDRDELAAALAFEGVPSSAGYIKQPLYLEPVFARKSFFPGSRWPAEVLAGKSFSYQAGDCPVAEAILATSIKIAIDETRTVDDIDAWIAKVKLVAREIAG